MGARKVCDVSILDIFTMYFFLFPLGGKSVAMFECLYLSNAFFKLLHQAMHYLMQRWGKTVLRNFIGAVSNF